MITVHHLANSRSHRIIWLLEELGIPYEVVFYERDPQTQFAPPALKVVHPLGKSPVVEDDGRLVIESGAIITYILSRYGEGHLAPPEHSSDWADYIQWMHYAEGSAMMPLRLMFYAALIGESAAPMRPRITAELANHFGYMEERLRDGHFVGGSFSAADIQMAFVLEGADSAGVLADYPKLSAFLSDMRARPAYQRALKRGGAVAFGR